MVVRIVDRPRAAFGSATRVGTSDERVVPGRSHAFAFWSGASGRRYVHTVYTLIECPELPRANYLLVRRDKAGRRVLRVGRLTHKAQSLNLAEIRHNGARLGANEVHVHLLGRTEEQRRQIELDLAAALGND